jgi:hypothetical protein
LEAVSPQLLIEYPLGVVVVEVRHPAAGHVTSAVRRSVMLCTRRSGTLRIDAEDGIISGISKVLDYETPPRQKPPTFSPLVWAMLIALFVHVLVFGFYAATLDGGVLASMCAVVGLGYWLVVVIIAARRRQCPTILDLAFVALGYPAMLFPCLYIVNGRL